MPVLQSWTINGGTNLEGVQRSIVRSIRVVFDTPVHIEPGGVALRLVNEDLGELPTFALATIDGGFTWDITFEGANTENANGLMTGIYRVVLDGTKILPALGAFHVLPGDGNGNRTVQSVPDAAGVVLNSELGQAAFKPWADFDADGVITAADVEKIRVGSSVPAY
jgi:hypothetical protein